MTDLSHILNWTLLPGSHDFPGPHGGTCVNEAAIVAAGFAYRPVGHARELPACFCPVIGAVSIWLNDGVVDDRLRMTLLLPFVPRLAGTRGDAAAEAARLERLRAALRTLTPQRQSRRRFRHRHQEHLLLGEWIGRWTVRSFTLASASDVRELLRIADHLKEQRPPSERAAFFTAMALALDSMLQVGPAPAPPSALQVTDRLRRAALAPGGTLEFV